VDTNFGDKAFEMVMAQLIGKNAILPTPPAFDTSVGVAPLKFH